MSRNLLRKDAIRKTVILTCVVTAFWYSPVFKEGGELEDWRRGQPLLTGGSNPPWKQVEGLLSGLLTPDQAWTLTVQEVSCFTKPLKHPPPPHSTSDAFPLRVVKMKNHPRRPARKNCCSFFFVRFLPTIDFPRPQLPGGNWSPPGAIFKRSPLHILKQASKGFSYEV